MSKKFLESIAKMYAATAPLALQAKIIADTAKPALLAMESMRQQLAPLMKSVEVIQRQFIPLFDDVYLKQLAAKSKEMKTPAFKKFMKEWGWFVDKKSFSFGDYCFALYKRYGPRKFKEKVNKWFYHQKHLNIVLKDVQSASKHRHSIIKQGFEHHRKKNYASAITLLLPQAEGMLWDLGMKRKCVRKGYNSTKKYKKYFTKKELRMLENKNKWAYWNLQDLSKELFPKDDFHKIIVKEIFCQGPRNKILHGRNIYRGTQKEITRWRSTLLVLTLWRLADEF